VRVLPSALKHGFTELDALHALQHPIRMVEDIRPDVDLYIGPSIDGILVEVLVDVAERESVLFHVDKLRLALAKYMKE